MFKVMRIFAAIVFLLVRPPAAWSGDLRVGFINPTGPPEFWHAVNATMLAAAAELGIAVQIGETGRSRDKAIEFAHQFLAENPPLDYLIATNDVDAGPEVIRLADAAHVKLILLNNELNEKDWAEFGEPRTKYRSWLGSIVPDHEGAGYGIATEILTEAARVKANRPLKILALTGDHETPAGNERVRGLKRAVGDMTKSLGPGSVELVEVRYLDWTAKTAEASVRQFTATGQRIDALWAANDPINKSPARTVSATPLPRSQASVAAVVPRAVRRRDCRLAGIELISQENRRLAALPDRKLGLWSTVRRELG